MLASLRGLRRERAPADQCLSTVRFSFAIRANSRSERAGRGGWIHVREQLAPQERRRRVTVFPSPAQPSLRFGRDGDGFSVQGGTSRLLCLCPLWVKMGRGGPAASVTRAIALPVAALRLWQRTTVGEFYGELSTPAPKIGVSGPYVRRGFRCNSRCLHRAGAEAETLGVMPSVPKRTSRQPHKRDRQLQRRVNRRSLKGLVRSRLNAAEAQGPA